MRIYKEHTNIKTACSFNFHTCFVRPLFIFFFIYCQICVIIKMEIAMDNLSEKDASLLNALSLAFIGDGVWTLFVRDYFCKHTDFKNSNLHRLTTKFVKAGFQSKALERLPLNDQEIAIARRARNVHNNTIAKNASLADYKKATSFEAVMGYLYLTGNFQRLNDFMSIYIPDLESSLKK